MFFVFIGFYIYHDLNRDYTVDPLKDKTNSPLYPKDEGSTIVPTQDNDLVVSNSVEVDKNTVINRKSNLNLDDIKNTIYYILDNKESNFVDGVFKRQSLSSQIVKYSFGDVNGDGSGDAIVVTSTSNGNSPIEELHVVLNKNGVPETHKVNPPVGDTDTAQNFNSISIRNGKIVLDMDILKEDDPKCCPSIKKTISYRFLKGAIVAVDDAISWKTYVDNKFGFEFMYPGDSKPVVKSVFIDGREVFDSINVIVPLKFDNSYNTWTEKAFEVSVIKQACPFRGKAEPITKNNINFYFFNPNYDETSNEEKILKQEEYMATKVGYCFIITNNVMGPGINSPSYPKSSIITTPPDIYEFFNQEFIILDRVLETFKFYKS